MMQLLLTFSLVVFYWAQISLETYIHSLAKLMGGSDASDGFVSYKLWTQGNFLKGGFKLDAP